MSLKTVRLKYINIFTDMDGDTLVIITHFRPLKARQHMDLKPCKTEPNIVKYRLANPLLSMGDQVIG